MVDDPQGLSRTILEAASRVKEAGQRILLSRWLTPAGIAHQAPCIEAVLGSCSWHLSRQAEHAPANHGLVCHRGWGKLGEGFEVPDNVLLLDSCPHDWLLPRCSAVVHHGGAGTTAAGAGLAKHACPPAMRPLLVPAHVWIFPRFLHVHVALSSAKASRHEPPCGTLTAASDVCVRDVRAAPRCQAGGSEKGARVRVCLCVQA